MSDITEPIEPGWYAYSGGRQVMVFHLRETGQWSAHFDNGTADDCAWGYIEQALGVWDLVRIDQSAERERAAAERLRAKVARVEALAGEWEVLADYVNDPASTADQRARSWAGVIASEQLRAALSAAQDDPVSEMRGTGGNRFIPGDATRPDLVAAIDSGLYELHEWAIATDQLLDVGAITITTRRVPSGAISVSVTGDLSPQDEG